MEIPAESHLSTEYLQEGSSIKETPQKLFLSSNAFKKSPDKLNVLNLLLTPRIFPIFGRSPKVYLSPKDPYNYYLFRRPRKGLSEGLKKAIQKTLKRSSEYLLSMKYLPKVTCQLNTFKRTSIKETPQKLLLSLNASTKSPDQLNILCLLLAPQNCFHHWKISKSLFIP